MRKRGDVAGRFSHHQGVPHQQGQRAVDGPAFGGVDLTHGTKTEGVRNQGIERVCRDRDHTSAAYE